MFVRFTDEVELVPPNWCSAFAVIFVMEDAVPSGPFAEEQGDESNQLTTHSAIEKLQSLKDKPGKAQKTIKVDAVDAEDSKPETDAEKPADESDSNKEVDNENTVESSSGIKDELPDKIRKTDQKLQVSDERNPIDPDAETVVSRIGERPTVICDAPDDGS